MKWFKLLSFSLEAKIWMFVLLINQFFFSFLAWLAYPETFHILVLSMIMFSLFSLLVGALLINNYKKKYDQTFYQFLQEPSREKEEELIKVGGENSTEQIHLLAEKFRTLQDQLNHITLQANDYEQYIESWVHEIKAPISLMTLVLENRKDEMSHLVFQRMENARIRLNDDVEKILFYSRLNDSHVDYLFQKLALEICLEDVLIELQELLNEKEVNVELNWEPAHVVSDEKALRFIFTQVLLNAIKYMKEEVNNTIWIHTGYSDEKNQFYAQIKDNGIGLLQSDLPFIFEKGFTGDNSDKKQSTGIGLFLVKRLCNDLNIDIEVNAAADQGFEIQFYFPDIN